MHLEAENTVYNIRDSKSPPVHLYVAIFKLGVPSDHRMMMPWKFYDDISKAQYTPPTPTRRNCRVASRRCRRCEHNSRRLPTDSVDNLETDQTDSIAIDYVSFDIDIDNFSTMTSSCRHSSLLQKLPILIKIHVVRHTAMESVWPISKLSTESVGSRCELVANCVHTADATRQFRRVGIGGVYWAWWSGVIVLTDIQRDTQTNTAENYTTLAAWVLAQICRICVYTSDDPMTILLNSSGTRSCWSDVWSCVYCV